MPYSQGIQSGSGWEKRYVWQIGARYEMLCREGSNLGLGRKKNRVWQIGGGL